MLSSYSIYSLLNLDGMSDEIISKRHLITYFNGLHFLVAEVFHYSIVGAIRRFLDDHTGIDEADIISCIRYREL